jgi:hypothetical protein
MEKEGYAMIAGIDNVWDKTIELISNYHAVQNILDKKSLPLNGAFLAADMIDTIIKSSEGKPE